MNRFKRWQSNIDNTISSMFSQIPYLGMVTTHHVHLAKDWIQKGSLAVLDQGVFSGSNLVANILMARWMISSDYGAYSYVFSIFLLISSIYSVLLLEPLSIFGSSRYIDNLVVYLRQMTRLHMRWASLIGISGIVVAILLNIFQPSSSLYKVILGFSFAQGMILYFWFARRSFYVNHQITKALRGTITYAALLLIGIIVLRILGQLTPFNAFLVFGLASLLGGSGILLTINKNPRLPSKQTLLINTLFQENWKYGRWLIVSGILFWLTNHAYQVLIGSLVSLAEAGALKALQNLTNPVIQINTALGLLFLPWASRRYAEGGWRTLKRDALVFSALSTIVAFLYLVLLFLWGDEFVRVIYDEKFSDTSWILPYLASVPVVAGLTSGWMTALRIMQKTSLVMIVDVFGAIFTVTAGIFLIISLGALGAVIGLVFSTACRLPVMIFIWRKVARQTRQL